METEYVRLGFKSGNRVSQTRFQIGYFSNLTSKLSLTHCFCHTLTVSATQTITLSLPLTLQRTSLSPHSVITDHPSLRRSSVSDPFLLLHHFADHPSSSPVFVFVWFKVSIQFRTLQFNILIFIAYIFEVLIFIFVLFCLADFRGPICFGVIDWFFGWWVSASFFMWVFGFLFLMFVSVKSLWILIKSLWINDE